MKKQLIDMKIRLDSLDISKESPGPVQPQDFTAGADDAVDSAQGERSRAVATIEYPGGFTGT